MKTTMMAGVCLLALVLTFTIAECGPSQEKRQAGCTLDSDLQSCITRIGQVTPETATDNVFCDECRDELLDYAERCAVTPNIVQSYKDTFNRVCDDDGDQTPDNNDDNDDNEGSGAAVVGATIFSTISALLVAVASAVN